MTNIIKKPSLVISDIQETNQRIITIRKETEAGVTHLSDVFSALPNGLVHKTETGMGATTLELSTLRNSIIVEPIIITASSKVYFNNKKSNIKALYIGSETKYHKKKINPIDIIKYINDSNIPVKKIVVVADSLKKVIDTLTANKVSVFKDYFILIDEIDSFQLDSTFRKSMDYCIEIYKKFKESNQNYRPICT